MTEIKPVVIWNFLISHGYSNGQLTRFTNHIAIFFIYAHRQQRTVRAAFNFTTILLYRGYLLDEFLQPNVPRGGIPPTSPAVGKCVEAALRLASFAADIETDETYNSAYWARIPWLIITTNSLH